MIGKHGSTLPRPRSLIKTYGSALPKPSSLVAHPWVEALKATIACNQLWSMVLRSRSHDREQQTTDPRSQASNTAEANNQGCQYGI
eukprot:7931599-Pyramimonas_sp.AAC.1